MENQMLAEGGTVATRLRAVVYAYALANIAVVALLLSTVTPAPIAIDRTAALQQVASAR